MSSPIAPVVLVDDSPEDLFLTQRLLEKAGISNPVVSIDGGEEAIRFLGEAGKKGRAQIPHFILCDVRMPKIDGLAVLKWVRSHAPLKEVYIAMHSGGDVPADRVRAIELGANEFLVKFPTIEEVQRIDAEANALHSVRR